MIKMCLTTKLQFLFLYPVVVFPLQWLSRWRTGQRPLAVSTGAQQPGKWEEQISKWLTPGDCQGRAWLDTGSLDLRSAAAFQC